MESSWTGMSGSTVGFGAGFDGEVCNDGDTGFKGGRVEGVDLDPRVLLAALSVNP